MVYSIGAVLSFGVKLTNVRGLEVEDKMVKKIKNIFHFIELASKRFVKPETNSTKVSRTLTY